jgi:hypothetical protein
MEINKIGEPTPPQRIGQKPGKGGNKMDYVTARFCMDRLDQSVGPQNWKNEFKEIGIDGHLICGVSIKCDGEWVTKWDVGTESNFEAEKGNFSDAFKRACVHWGIGRDLYKEPTESFVKQGKGKKSGNSAVVGTEPSPVSVSEKVETEIVVDSWEEVQVHFGKNAGVPLGDLKPNQLEWYQTKWTSNDPSEEDKILRKALDKSMKKGGTKDGFGG